jgi:hypothetical protein
MSGEASKSEYSVRPSTPEDALALNALYQRVSGRVRSLEQWRWEWLATPNGRAPSWVIVESASGKIVGHHGLIELALRCGERTLRAARTDNTMVDPEYRTTLYYPGFEAQLFKSYRDGYDVVFTAVAGEVLTAMRRRLGYRPIGAWIDVVVADTLGYRASRSLGRAGGAVAKVIERSRASAPRKGDELVATTDVERVERLWLAARHSGDVTPERSAAFLRWRLVEHAWHGYRLALLVRDGTDSGFVAWREREAGGGAKRALIHDVFVRDGEDASYRELLQAFAWSLRDESVRIQVRTLDADTPLARVARALEPERLREREAEGDTLLLAYSAARDLPERWDVTTLVDAGI